MADIMFWRMLLVCRTLRAHHRRQCPQRVGCPIASILSQSSGHEGKRSPHPPDIARYSTILYDLPAKRHDMFAKSYDLLTQVPDHFTILSDTKSECLTDYTAILVIARKRARSVRFRGLIVLIRAAFVGFRAYIVRYRSLSCESGQMMNHPTPIPAMTLPISLGLHQQLLVAAIQSDFKKEAWEIGAAAIRDWQVRNQPDTFAMPVTSGYQWKNVFLLQGTLLRTVFREESQQG